ncbi:MULTISPECIES: hypothetical protein [Burkholderia]|nr:MULTISPECIES: hypothetical protein [Burkholderia]MBJ9663861.1 hypothetical protein [Burkholderia gladioli]MBU9167274.1 hypothetical protein [Burkholderia gladioli]MBU9215807.1 hypothetical protein [Burkholderia gladioli]MBU9379049.1 hypothetical protein [Burkholderia gladioli]MDC6131561.1 hypothetical protein [Burkholderia gladioli]
MALDCAGNAMPADRIDRVDGDPRDRIARRRDSALGHRIEADLVAPA